MVPIQVIVKRPWHKAEALWLIDALREGVYVQPRSDSLSAEFVPYTEGVKVYEHVEPVASALQRVVLADTEALFLERLRLLYPPLPVIPPDEPDSLVEEIGADRFVLHDGTELTFQFLERMFHELSTDSTAQGLLLEQPPISGNLGAARFAAAMAETAEVFRMLADRG